MVICVCKKDLMKENNLKLSLVLSYHSSKQVIIVLLVYGKSKSFLYLKFHHMKNPIKIIWEPKELIL